ELSWREFAVNWESDVKVAFHFCKAALARSLRAGASVVLISSGALADLGRVLCLGLEILGGVGLALLVASDHGSRRIQVSGVASKRARRRVRRSFFVCRGTPIFSRLPVS